MCKFIFYHNYYYDSVLLLLAALTKHVVTAFEIKNSIGAIVCTQITAR